MSDERPSVDDLLGIDPGWCGDQSVDEYMAEVRGERYAPAPSPDVLGDPEGAEEEAVRRDKERTARDDTAAVEACSFTDHRGWLADCEGNRDALDAFAEMVTGIPNIDELADRAGAAARHAEVDAARWRGIARAAEELEEAARRDRARQVAEVHAGAGWTRQSGEEET